MRPIGGAFDSDNGRTMRAPKTVKNQRGPVIEARARVLSSLTSAPQTIAKLAGIAPLAEQPSAGGPA